jgi:hypothetical protein
MGKLKGNTPLEDLIIDERITLNLILKKHGTNVGWI